MRAFTGETKIERKVIEDQLDISVLKSESPSVQPSKQLHVSGPSKSKPLQCLVPFRRFNSHLNGWMDPSIMNAK